MQKKKIISYLVAGLGLFVAIIGIDGIRRRFAPPKVSTEAESIMKSYRDRLERGNDQSPEFFNAILQLARIQESGLLPRLWEMILGDSIGSRAAAAEALGFYADSEESERFWKDCLTSKISSKSQGLTAQGSASQESTLKGSALKMPLTSQGAPSEAEVMKKACLKGLGKKPSSAGAQILMDWRLSHRDFGVDYWLATESLWEATDDEAQKLDLQNELESWIHKNSNDKNILTPYLLLVRKGRYSKALRDLSVALFESTTVERLRPVILSYLAQKDDREFLGRWAQYLKTGNEGLKKTALRFSHLFCAPDRSSVLASFLSQKENRKYLGEALVGVNNLGEIGNALVLDQIRQRDFWSPNDLQQIDEVSALLRQSGLTQSSSCRRGP